jgi:citrate lyase subunit beta / citryl-CoA lyase
MDSGASGVIFDLEDSVPHSEKAVARRMVSAVIAEWRAAPLVIGRISETTGATLTEDLSAILSERLSAILVPKVEAPDTLNEVDHHLSHLETERGISVGTVELIGVIESALGVVRADEIAADAPSRTRTLSLGPADLARDLSVDLSKDLTELFYARTRLVVAARAAGLASPIDGAYPIDDTDAIVADTRLSKKLGFQGRIVAQRSQIPIIRDTYTYISPEEVEEAHKIVLAFRAAKSQGIGLVYVDGRAVAEPVYVRALEKLREAEAAPID